MRHAQDVRIHDVIINAIRYRYGIPRTSQSDRYNLSRVNLYKIYMQRDLLAMSNQSPYSLAGKVALVTGSSELHFPLRPAVTQYPSTCSKQTNRCRHRP